MNDKNTTNEHAWDSGWDAHTIEQRRRLARLSLSEKLKWLEEAQRVAQRLARVSGDREASTRASDDSESASD